MARSIRIEYPGAFYHVMARGNRREAIFNDDATQSEETGRNTSPRLAPLSKNAHRPHFPILTPLQTSKRLVRSNVASPMLPSSFRIHPSPAPLSPQTPFLPDSGPASAATRKSKFLAAERGSLLGAGSKRADLPPSQQDREPTPEERVEPEKRAKQAALVMSTSAISLVT